MKDLLFYLATPYAKYNPGKFAAVYDAAFHQAKLLKAGLNVFAPIPHWHTASLYIKENEIDWLELDKVFLARCDGLIICSAMEGWQESEGIKVELDWWGKNKNWETIYYYDGNDSSIEGIFNKIERGCWTCRTQRGAV